MPQYFQTNVGPILLAVNPYCNVGNPLNLESTKDNSEEGIGKKKEKKKSNSKLEFRLDSKSIKLYLYIILYTYHLQSLKR